MENKLFEIKALISAFFAAAGLFLGWKGVLALVWVLAMALDYISGTVAACRAGEWSSATAREGLYHKGGMILVVVVAVIADVVLQMLPQMPGVAFEYPGLVVPLVLAWYILTEVGSVLENAVAMGAPVPAWLVKVLKVGFAAVDRGIDPEEGK